jgi:hypothetical protein
MTQAWQHEIYQPHWYYMLEEWANNLCIIPLGCHRRMAWWCCCCRSPSHTESWSEKIDSPVELPKCVATLFDRSANMGVLQRGWLESHALDRAHGLSLIKLERTLKFQGKPEYLDSQIGWSGFGRFSLHQRCVPETEIGPTFAQAASGWGKERIMAKFGTTSGRDGWEQEEEFEVEGKLH